MTDNNPSDSQKPTDELHWIETYFIVFPQGQRPTLAQVEQALAKADPRMLLENLASDPEGRFESLLVESPEDHAAVEVSYESGESVIEQNLQWAEQLQEDATTAQMQLLLSADARLDVAHFERLPAGAPKAKASSKPQEEPWGGSSDPFPSSAGDAFGLEDEGFEDEMGDPEMEMLDPTCLLTVVETLSTLTQGLAFDPASGELV